ncbi:class I SAM-dependent methyltransferase [Thiothrix lacustris]|uniref:Class I SAM-dependent methyltransferase n=1 Tax=Thiothrix lacustris TaxID=525917 RepID=A0ABY9MTU4_9GAMM|nr:class I SAM-dependent methyltransferase [Thiothrix lacustris]WML91575.1 class I SAM-dependent methyltransferase [Thiothrix lacustris]
MNRTDANIICIIQMDKEKSLNVTSTTSLSPAAINACRDWYASAAGQITLARVQRIVSGMSTDIFGYYALETGVLAGKHSFLEESRIASQFSLGAVEGEPVSVRGTPEHLPFSLSNLDLVIASHALDCTDHPHQVLREIERVLVPEGHCILIAFNPISFRGLGQLRYLFKPHARHCQFYSTFRVREWLSVLGFEVCEIVSTGFCPVFNGHYVFKQDRWLDRLGSKFRLMTGNVTIIHAQKKVSNMTPLLPARKVKPVLRSGMVVNPGVGRFVRKESNDAK